MSNYPDGVYEHTPDAPWNQGDGPEIRREDVYEALSLADDLLWFISNNNGPLKNHISKIGVKALENLICEIRALEAEE